MVVEPIKICSGRKNWFMKNVTGNYGCYGNFRMNPGITNNQQLTGYMIVGTTVSQTR